jgi:hypothetical protein
MANISIDCSCSTSGGGSDANFVYTQSTPASTWVVVHNLDKFPSVSVVDSAKTEVVGDVVYDSLTQVTITFSASFSGFAYFN